VLGIFDDMKKGAVTRTHSPHHVPDKHERRGEDNASPGLPIGTLFNQSTDFFLTNETGSTSNIKMLREYYTTAKSLSSEFCNASNLSLPLRIHSQQASKVYSALATLLYSSISIAKADELERYVRKKAAQLPRSLIDMEQWVYVLQIAKDSREGPENRAILQELEFVKQDSRALLYSTALATRNAGNDWRQLKSDVETQLSSMQNLLVDAKAMFLAKITYPKATNKFGGGGSRPKSAVTLGTDKLSSSRGRNVLVETAPVVIIKAASSGCDSDQASDVNERLTLAESKNAEMQATIDSLVAECGMKQANIDELVEKLDLLTVEQNICGDKMRRLSEIEAEHSADKNGWVLKECSLLKEINTLRETLNRTQTTMSSYRESQAQKVDVNSVAAEYDFKLRALEVKLKEVMDAQAVSSEPDQRQKRMQTTDKALLEVDNDVEELIKQLKAEHEKAISDLKADASAKLFALDDRHALEHESTLSNFHKSVSDMNQRHHQALVELRESLVSAHGCAVDEMKARFISEVSELRTELSDAHEARMEELGIIEEMAQKIESMQELEQAARNKILELEAALTNTASRPQDGPEQSVAWPSNETSAFHSTRNPPILISIGAVADCMVTSAVELGAKSSSYVGEIRRLQEQLDRSKSELSTAVESMERRSKHELEVQSRRLQLEFRCQLDTLDKRISAEKESFHPSSFPSIPTSSVPHKAGARVSKCISAIENLTADDISAYYENILGKLHDEHRKEVASLRMASVSKAEELKHAYNDDQTMADELIENEETTVSEKRRSHHATSAQTDEINSLKSARSQLLVENLHLQEEVKALRQHPSEASSKQLLAEVDCLRQESAKAKSSNGAVAPAVNAGSNGCKSLTSGVLSVTKRPLAVSSGGHEGSFQSSLVKTMAAQVVMGCLINALQSTTNAVYFARVRCLQQALNDGQAALETQNAYAEMNILSFNEQIVEMNRIIETQNAAIAGLTQELKQRTSHFPSASQATTEEQLYYAGKTREELIQELKDAYVCIVKLEDEIRLPAVDPDEGQVGLPHKEFIMGSKQLDELLSDVSNKNRLIEEITSIFNDKLLAEKIRCDGTIMDLKARQQHETESTLQSAVDSIHKQYADNVMSMQASFQGDLESMQRRIMAGGLSQAKNMRERHLKQMQELKSTLERHHNGELLALTNRHSEEIAAYNNDKTLMIERYENELKSLRNRYGQSSEGEVAFLVEEQVAAIRQVQKKPETDVTSKSSEMQAHGQQFVQARETDEAGRLSSVSENAASYELVRDSLNAVVAKHDKYPPLTPSASPLVNAPGGVSSRTEIPVVNVLTSPREAASWSLEGKLAEMEQNAEWSREGLLMEINLLKSSNDALCSEVTSLTSQLEDLKQAVLTQSADSVQLQAQAVDNLFSHLHDVTSTALLSAGDDSAFEPPPFGCLRVGLGDDSLEDVGEFTLALELHGTYPGDASLETSQKRIQKLMHKLKQVSSGMYSEAGIHTGDIQTLQMNELKNLEALQSQMHGDIGRLCQLKGDLGLLNEESVLHSIPVNQCVETDVSNMSPLELVSRLRGLTAALVSEHLVDNADTYMNGELSQTSVNIAGTVEQSGVIPLQDADTDGVLTRAKNLLRHLQTITTRAAGEAGVSNFASIPEVSPALLPLLSSNSSVFAESLTQEVQRIQGRVDTMFHARINRLVEKHLAELDALSALNQELNVSRLQQLQIAHQRDVDVVQNEFQQKFRELSSLWNIVRESYECELQLLRKLTVPCLTSTKTGESVNQAVDRSSNKKEVFGTDGDNVVSAVTSSVIGLVSAMTSSKIINSAVSNVLVPVGVAGTTEYVREGSTKDSGTVSKLRDNENIYLKQIEKQLGEYANLTKSYQSEKAVSDSKSKRIAELEVAVSQMQSELDHVRSRINSSADEFAQFRELELKTSEEFNSEIQRQINDNSQLMLRLAEEKQISVSLTQQVKEFEGLLQKIVTQNNEDISLLRDELVTSSSRSVENKDNLGSIASGAHSGADSETMKLRAATNIARIFSPLVIDTVLKSRKETPKESSISGLGSAAVVLNQDVSGKAEQGNNVLPIAQLVASDAELESKLAEKYNHQLILLQNSLMGEKDRIVNELVATISELQQTVDLKNQDIAEKSSLLDQVQAQTRVYTGGLLQGEVSVYEGSQDGSSDLMFREGSIESGGSALRRITDEFRLLQQSEPFRMKSSVKMQAHIRGFLVRNRFRRKQLAELATSQGVLVACAGTKQGRTGWYQSNGMFFYFCLDKVHFNISCRTLL
jgi:hypothetical protein